MNTCLICIGSNYDREMNCALARRMLHHSFFDIRFSTETETEPLGMKNKAKFSNQLALFDTVENKEQVICLLKEIEHAAGRCPEDKQKEKISLDIDLLMFNGKVLKPEDMKRNYVRMGMDELAYHLD